MAYCGFSVHGVTDTQLDLGHVPLGADRSGRLRNYGYEQARLTSACGGNALRVFYCNSELCAAISPIPLDLSLVPAGCFKGAWHKLERGTKVKIIEEIAAVIWKIADALLAMDAAGNGLAISDLDDYLDGIRRFNAVQLDASSRVRVLLTNVTAPPVPILECPSDDQLAWHAVPFRFADLFGRWCEIHILLARKLVNRYATAPGDDPLVAAFEINNEPDYEWLPDEHRIERSRSPDTMPTYKYITELHQPQIPDRYPPVIYAEKTLWGGYQEQGGNWKSDCGAHIPVLDFPWGPKFDWYVSRYAEWAKHVSFAFFDEGQRLGRRFEIVAAGVTHNNLDYLIRMHRADPGAFLYCTVIAFHPYHWPEHNIHDMKFRDRRDYTDWRQQSPHSFAARYFKCFDFFKQFNEFIVDTNDLWPGFKGKRIWLTEFGIGTKLHGEYNSVNAQFVPFIRPAGMPADRLPTNSVVWEELWTAFLTTITPEYLHELNVEAMFFYALREVAVQGLDKHDDDRTNFAIMNRCGQPRLGRAVFDRLSGFIRDMTGRATDPALVSFPLVPDWARWRDFSLPLLKSEPWRHVAVPAPVMDTMSMLSQEERRFLYWVTSEYYQARGSVLDAGCFVGGSTVALAMGLQAHWPEPHFVVESYDRFLTDDYMREHYFEPHERKIEGGSFRHIFDENISSVANKVRVTEGDITATAWTGQPIEILFIDVCKCWEVNDFVAREFYPSLIPGQSLVIQQDFFHNWEFWIIATMELLIDRLEFVAHVPVNTAVFRLVRPIERDEIPERLRDLGLPALVALLERHIGRYSDPFQRAMLMTALACLYLDFGDRDQACAAAARALRESRDHWVQVAVNEMGLTDRDVARAVEGGSVTSGRQHYDPYERGEERRPLPPSLVVERASRFAREWSVPPGETFAVEPLDDLRRYFDAVDVGLGIWKWEQYFEVYERHLSKFRGREVRIVEVGIYSGGSLGMWKAYFGPGCRVYGVDIEQACKVYESDSVRVFIGDQADRSFWARFKEQIPPVDIVIDDGGHLPEQQAITLEEMLPHIRPGGVYICEDILGSENDFAYYMNGLSNELHAATITGSEDRARRLVCFTSPFQSAIHSVHHYPFISVIERRAKPVAEFVAPQRGTQWQPFLS